jgi:CHAD domain-containing protein
MMAKEKGDKAEARPKAAKSVRELEAKFRVHSPFEMPAVAGVVPEVVAVDPPKQTTLTAVYYDTADLRLAREGITLRRRSGGNDAGWHLKLPVVGFTVPDGTGARDEIQLPDAVDVPAELRELVTAWVRAGELGPVATLVTERTKLLLRAADGSALAELVDDTVTAEDTSHIQARFREIELEDVGGGAELLASVAAVLQDAGAVAGEFVPKVVRALGPRATAPPEPPLPQSVAPRDPAHDVVAAVLREHTRRLMAEDVRVRRDLPDAVHQMRIAARRLRSAFVAFRPMLDDGWVSSLLGELTWLVRLLGAARDAEVLRDRLLAAASDLPDVAKPDAVRSRLRDLGDADVAGARAAVLDALNGERYVALLERLIDAATYPRAVDGARRPAGSAVLPIVRTSWAKLARRVARLERDRVDGPRYIADHHRVRIAAKQLRYVCDAVAPVFGDDAVRLSKQAERVQELLGEHQDAVVAAAYVADAVGRPRSGNVAFGLGMMFARQEAIAALAREEFAGVWQEVARPKHRRWLAD